MPTSQALNKCDRSRIRQPDFSFGARTRTTVQSPAPKHLKTFPCEIVNPIDGANMVLIPAGKFLMGNPKEESWSDEHQHPQHSVHLDEYYIYKYEVTNEQFWKFVNETGYGAEGKWDEYFRRNDYWNTESEHHPVINVTWNDAGAYCKWAGGWLPTEAQWEKAARGEDGRIYPWGNDWEGKKLNWYNGPKVLEMAIITQGRGTLPVGSFPSGASPYGCMDMVGNVWEWCNDWYDEDYYKQSPLQNPDGPSSGIGRVVRGGSWNESRYNKFRCAVRSMHTPSHRSNVSVF